MTPPRLHIRLDVDVDHARRALVAARRDAQRAEPALLAATVQALRERLECDLAVAYPDARISVAAWPRSPKERPTRVRMGFRVADGPTEARCAIIREHVESLRSAAILTLLSPQAADAPPAPVVGEISPAPNDPAATDAAGGADELAL